MKNIITTIITFLLILLFMYTAVSKILDFKTFIIDLNNQPFPNAWTPVLSLLIPSVEIIIATLLFFEKTTIAGLAGAVIIMTAFTTYTVLVLLKAFTYVPCSCGGVIEKLSWPQHFIFNLFFLFISVAALALKTNFFPKGLQYFMHENRGSRKPA